MKKNVIKLSALAIGLTVVVSLSSCKHTESDKEAPLANKSDMEIEQNENTDNSYPANPTAEYLAYVDRSTLEPGEDLHTKEAINKLAAAVEEKSQNLKATPNDSLTAMVPNVDDNNIETDTTITTDSFYSKGHVVVNVLENLQKENFPELSDDINELKESWNKLEKAKKTNYGEMAVNSFFNKAADLLEEMNTNTPDGTVSASYVGSDSTQYSSKGDTIKMKKQ